MGGKDWVGSVPSPKKQADQKRKSIVALNRKKSLEVQKKIEGKLDPSKVVVKHVDLPPAADKPGDKAKKDVPKEKAKEKEKEKENLKEASKEEKKKKAKRKCKYPQDVVRHNPDIAAQKRIRLALFRAQVDCSLMERELLDYYCHMNLRSRRDTGPKFSKKDLKIFRDTKIRCRNVLEPRCLAHEDVTAAEYKALKIKASQAPHIRYLTCPCTVIMDVLEDPLPPLPRLRTPTFQ